MSDPNKPTFSTTSDSPVTVIPPGDDAKGWKLNITNVGVRDAKGNTVTPTADGLYSVDGGATWHPLAAGSVLGVAGLSGVKQLQVKRVPGGADLVGVSAEIE